MLRKSLLGFLFLFLLGANGVVGYVIYDHFTKDRPSLSNLDQESMDVINMIAKATDGIRNGAPIRSKRGIMPNKDYEAIMDYLNKYNVLLDEDSNPKEYGYTESEQALVNYVVGLFVSYGLMNEQFILGDTRFASSIMDGLYEDLDKATPILWLASQKSLTMDYIKGEDESDTEDVMNESEKKEQMSESEEEDIELQKTDESVGNADTMNEDVTDDPHLPANLRPEGDLVGNPNSPYALTIEQRKELEQLVESELGADFVFDPNKEYDTSGWPDAMIEALMAADTLYYDAKGIPSPNN
ncbi:hypothetical protein [Pseudobacillus wudalianchiensis]|uniref:Uncharacterized protein n=1 Tax=Pseudobacillus wudalianchiensis TaxID=1743143 RepID=A0A1B9B2E9_9BACI|nr:hypothetical protein [Bacillus wudalianchiensis]OCA90299.1 hypothetical protein A8F95_21120 [Bacillus wudalianchiensis]